MTFYFQDLGLGKGAITGWGMVWYCEVNLVKLKDYMVVFHVVV